MPDSRILANYGEMVIECRLQVVGFVPRAPNLTGGVPYFCDAPI